MTDFLHKLQQIANQPQALSEFGRGIEREALRISPEGALSQRPHPAGLGSPLSHQWITTDFAESLLEFITPVSTDINTTLHQLEDIHRFSYTQMDGERLWPMSMPCFVSGDDQINLAQYGSSNIGRMKTLYREGLKHRYGSTMQIISGVHFNFSFSDAFWDALFGEQTEQVRQDAVSDAYFGLIRNYYRFGWMIPYLFGASPALCKSFINETGSQLAFEEIGRGTRYLDNATSLRLSDLGYTNSAQSCLRIGFNSLEQYVGGLQQAIRTPSEDFAEIGVKVDGEYRQLNSNILQIENELYAPIRPKRVAHSGEKPSEALQRGGVQYIEVRSLDVNPFSPVGIDGDQIRFLDLFLTWAVLKDSAPMTDSELTCWRANWNAVVLDGRNPDLTLRMGCNSEPQRLHDIASAVFADLRLIAIELDGVQGGSAYTDTCDKLMGWVSDPSLTLSAQLLERILAEQSIVNVGLALAQEHQQTLAAQDSYQVYSLDDFNTETAASQIRQQDIEKADNVTFDKFLEEYFADLH
uniref:glutamate--cysteine ligase n=1 Tax=Thaumasiovibrio occultus TaxID=1891184 RepID=UPI000B35586B|nr:glutamate--cysteine ligase [Thaumasiovibrio occultus]